MTRYYCHVPFTGGKLSDLSQVAQLVGQLSSQEPGHWSQQPYSTRAVCDLRPSPGGKEMWRKDSTGRLQGGGSFPEGHLCWWPLSSQDAWEICPPPSSSAFLLPPTSLKDQPSPETQPSIRYPANLSSWELWNHALFILEAPGCQDGEKTHDPAWRCFPTRLGPQGLH